MNKKGLSTKKIVMIALFTALIMIATLLIRFPVGTGYLNAGDAVIFLSVFLLGPYGIIASSLGSALADLVGYAIYAPATLVIKGLMAFVAWVVYRAFLKCLKKSLLAEILASVAGAIVMVIGYFLYEAILFSSFGVALVGLPWNFLQGGAGVVLSVLLMRLMKTIKVA